MNFNKNDYGLTSMIWLSKKKKKATLFIQITHIKINTLFTSSLGTRSWEQYSLLHKDTFVVCEQVSKSKA